MTGHEFGPSQQQAENSVSLDPYSLLLSGARYQYLALDSRDSEVAAYYHDQAIAGFKTVKSMTEGARTSTVANMLATYSLDLDEILRPLIVDHRMPDLDTVDHTNRRVISSLYKSIDTKTAPSELSQIYDTFAVLSLLHFWQVHIYGEKDWLAVLSFISKPLTHDLSIEDIAYDGHISVYTRYNDAISQIYSIQVNRDVDVTVNDNNRLSVVDMSNLKLDGESSVSSQKIISDLYLKRYQACAERAKILIDILG